MVSANAQKIDGVNYKLNSSTKEATVTSLSGSGKYTGHIAIPSSITVNGTEYSVTSIGKSAFQECIGLTSLTIPNSVTSIGDYAFENCSGLTSTSIEIPNSVTSIGEYAFAFCRGLTSVTIPGSVTSIGYSAFSGCSGLTSVTIPNSVTSIASWSFSGCSALTSVTIPNSITLISTEAFKGCQSLTSLTIPNGVTYIAEGAFNGCSGLTSVTIPQSINVINNDIFSGCTSLKDVYCHIESVPSTSASAFKDASISSATLHVPAIALTDYKSIAPWSGFGNIIALNSDEVPTVKKCATPTISYTKGKLSFKCSTNGASCVSTITDADIKTHNGNEINLSVTYNISVYAKATDYEDSDIATATLCWIDSNPKTEGIANGMAKVEAKPVLIQSSNGVLTITSEGNTEVTPIKVYNTAGQMKGSSSMTNGMATLDSNMDSGEIAIVKIGEKSVKVVVK